MGTAELGGCHARFTGQVPSCAGRCQRLRWPALVGADAKGPPVIEGPTRKL